MNGRGKVHAPHPDETWRALCGVGAGRRTVKLQRRDSMIRKEVTCPKCLQIIADDPKALVPKPKPPLEATRAKLEVVAEDGDLHAACVAKAYLELLKMYDAEPKHGVDNADQIESDTNAFERIMPMFRDALKKLVKGEAAELPFSTPT